MWQGVSIAVVVPAFREQRLIGRTLAGIPDWVDTIVLVDDASPDDTLGAARAATHGRHLLVLRHATNRGVGASIASGYQHALDAGAEVIAVMAGDNQMHPEDLEAVIAPVARGDADYVKGNRWLHPERAAMPLLRRLGGRVLSALTRLATSLSVSDTQCGYTAINAATARALPLGELWPRYGYPNDLLGMLAARQRRVVEVPVRPVYADEASGLRPWHVASIACVIARRWNQERGASGARALGAPQKTA